MSRLRLLDLFCCEGGSAVGYARAGFDVYGVDLFQDHSQRRYPFDSHRGDAVEFLKEHGHEFDAAHASPPCWRHSAGTRARSRDHYPDLVAPTRGALVASGLPYVIENVVGAPLLDPVMLCGRQFGLTAVDDDGVVLHLDRHRMFESNVPLVSPASCHPHDRSLQVGGSYGGARRDKHKARHERHGGYVPAKHVQEALLGINWMTQKGLHQALPPVYTQWVGHQLALAVLGGWSS